MSAIADQPAATFAGWDAIVSNILCLVRLGLLL